MEIEVAGKLEGCNVTIWKGTPEEGTLKRHSGNVCQVPEKEQEAAPLRERSSLEHYQQRASLESTVCTGINVAEASLPRRRPLQTCTPRTYVRISAIPFPDALPWREHGFSAI
uniref:Uncharacterized protein n=1 Tax=Rangifer tarandus platyrhynchus TaxID=3082113 RepID=A0ACB0DRR6_RANTA|nr:unnamed protein product [Rangifer tarandus platyrhynchus]